MRRSALCRRARAPGATDPGPVCEALPDASPSKIVFFTEYFPGFSSYTRRMEQAMNKIISWLLSPPTKGPKSTLLLRLMAGGVFFWEGLLKFVYTNQGVGRFTK